MSELTDAIECLNDRKAAAVDMEANDDTVVGFVDQDVYRRILSDLDIDVLEMYAVADDVAHMLFPPAALTSGPITFGSSCYLEGFMVALMLMHRRKP